MLASMAGMSALLGNWTEFNLAGHTCRVFEPMHPSPQGFVVVYLHCSAAAPIGRTFHISTAGTTQGTIRPAHPFTRRAFVECNDSVPELVQLFAFWLAALTWKRAAKNNS